MTSIVLRLFTHRSHSLTGWSGPRLETQPSQLSGNPLNNLYAAQKLEQSRQLLVCKKCSTISSCMSLCDRLPQQDILGQLGYLLCLVSCQKLYPTLCLLLIQGGFLATNTMLFPNGFGWLWRNKSHRHLLNAMLLEAIINELLDIANLKSLPTGNGH